MEIRVNEQRLNTLLVAALAYAYIRLFWAVLSAVLNVFALTVLLVLTTAPAVEFLRRGARKLLTQ